MDKKRQEKINEAKSKDKNVTEEYVSDLNVLYLHLTTRSQQRLI